MQTQIHINFQSSNFATQADEILRRCVHCGFCNATCPTYQLLGDELDGPRGRIYLIKQMLETGQSTSETQTHLDRCLTCLNCETTCPSGVEYGKLVSIGRQISSEQVPRAVHKQFIRWAMRQVLSRREWMVPLIKLAAFVRPVLPGSLQRQLPRRQQLNHDDGQTLQHHLRTVILPAGCAQQAFAAEINQHCRTLLNKIKVTAVEISSDGCCGALSEHLTAQDEAQRQMKQNIDAWWPQIENGAEAIISTASACGLMIKDYAHLLATTDYAEKANRVSAMCQDISEFLMNEDLSELPDASNQRIAVHTPCTLQHGQGIQGNINHLLEQRGYHLTHVDDAHLCCGSAGSYAILQRSISQKLLHNKVNNLLADTPDTIATANIGCLLHLRSGTPVQVLHWLQLLN